jgi:hypothetical protein
MKKEKLIQMNEQRELNLYVCVAMKRKKNNMNEGRAIYIVRNSVQDNQRQT